ncbi:MAG: magnesium transporter, partial [Acidimicrobiales bacterium]
MTGPGGPLVPSAGPPPPGSLPAPPPSGSAPAPPPPSGCASTPTRCPARTRLYRNGALALEGFPVEDISDYLAEAGTVVWLDLC